MRLDFDLVRAILMAVENVPANQLAGVVTVAGYDEDTVLEHLAVLKERGLITAALVMVDNPAKRIATAFVHRLTWAGHEFLANARNEQIWSRTKAVVAEKGGSVSFDIFKALLTQVATKFVLG